MANNKGFMANTIEAMGNNWHIVLIGAFVLGGVGTWSHSMYSTYQTEETNRAKIKAGLELKTGDYNGNNILDKFYEIDGVKVPVEVDGRPAIEYFKNQ